MCDVSTELRHGLPRPLGSDAERLFSAFLLLWSAFFAGIRGRFLRTNGQLFFGNWCFDNRGQPALPSLRARSTGDRKRGNRRAVSPSASRAMKLFLAIDAVRREGNRHQFCWTEIAPPHFRHRPYLPASSRVIASSRYLSFSSARAMSAAWSFDFLSHHSPRSISSAGSESDSCSSSRRRPVILRRVSSCSRESVSSKRVVAFHLVGLWFSHHLYSPIQGVRAHGC